MKVLQVGKYYPPVPGGIENNVHALSVGLAARYEVTALVFNTGTKTVQEHREGVRVVRVGSLGRLFSTEVAPTFPLWFRKLRCAEIVHLHTPNPVGELACLDTLSSSKLVITYHSDVVRQKKLKPINNFILHRLLQRADRVIAYTQRYVETSPILRHYAAKTAIIPHGIDLAEFALTPVVAQKAEALRAQYGPRIVLFVGRLVYYKGLDDLLRALAAVPDARLLIVGSGPLQAAWQHLARDLGVADRAVFLGPVGHEDKVACYYASDLMALPATHRAEAFGQVQVEAMACGCPVVSTNIDSGVPFVNQDQVTGLVVEPRCPSALAAALRALLDDPAWRCRLGQAGRQRAESLFSREVMIRDSLKLFDDLHN
jgi:glycosyltransferase involved in cell wall biosynthesis